MERTCFDCVHSLIDPGCYPSRHDPGYAASADCGLIENNDDQALQDWFDSLEEISPKHCEHFQPRMTGKCSICGTFVKSPKSESVWQIDGSHQCSEVCHKEAVERFESDWNFEASLQTDEALGLPVEEYYEAV